MAEGLIKDERIIAANPPDYRCGTADETIHAWARLVNEAPARLFPELARHLRGPVDAPHAEYLLHTEVALRLPPIIVPNWSGLQPIGIDRADERDLVIAANLLKTDTLWLPRALKNTETAAWAPGSASRWSWTPDYLGRSVTRYITDWYLARTDGIASGRDGPGARLFISARLRH